MISADILSNPGFWVLMALPAFSLVHFAAAWRVRQLRVKLVSMAEDILADPKVNDADRAWVIAEIESSGSQHQGWLGFFAPVLFIFALIVGAFETRRSDQRELTFKSMKDDLDNMSARAVKFETGVDPRDGEFWHDPRRDRMTRTSLAILDLRSPFASAWSYLWIGGAIAILGLFWGFSNAVLYMAQRTVKITNVPSHIAFRYLSHHCA